MLYPIPGKLSLGKIDPYLRDLCPFTVQLHVYSLQGELVRECDVDILESGSYRFCYEDLPFGEYTLTLYLHGCIIDSRRVSIVA
jgi:hypothetical protein